MSATRINIDTVYQALKASSSQDDADQRKLGEEPLNTLKILPGFHNILQNVYLNPYFPLSARCFAATYL